MWNLNIEPTLTKRMVGVSRSSLTGVDTLGAVATLPITKMAEVTQLSIQHLNAGSFNVQIFSDSTLSTQIFEAIEETARLDISKMGLMFANSDTPASNNIYIKVIPTTGSGHSFAISLFYDKL